jgi:hypothetical protein
MLAQQQSPCRVTARVLLNHEGREEDAANNAQRSRRPLDGRPAAIAAPVFVNFVPFVAALRGLPG